MRHNEFARRLKILLWAAVHHDIRHCRFYGPVDLRVKRRYPPEGSSFAYPALEVSLAFYRPSIYLPYEVQEAYDQRDWTEQQWADCYSDIPF